MPLERFSFLTLDQDLYLFNCRYVDGQGIGQGIDRGHFRGASPGMIHHQTLPEIDQKRIAAFRLDALQFCLFRKCIDQPRLRTGQEGFDHFLRLPFRIFFLRDITLLRNEKALVGIGKKEGHFLLFLFFRRGVFSRGRRIDIIEQGDEEECQTDHRYHDYCGKQQKPLLLFRFFMLDLVGPPLPLCTHYSSFPIPFADITPLPVRDCR
ncbi:MAG: hypothetical protein ACD_87C00239G0002 [uncultured bacterium]|nr:MAG: hypothetical protein ACD_87C00239G0002 [uncultured bacterium]